MNNKLIIYLFLWITSCTPSIAQTSNLVSIDVNGKLTYAADSKGNKVPDFSGVGYMNSELAIPTIEVVKTVNPVSGDNLANVQSAIDEVAALTPDANGFRGAILFKAGNYNISDIITINTSGIVLRGEGFNGSGTNFIATKTSQHTLFNFAGSTGTALSYSSLKAVTDTYVSIGSKQVTVANGHTFVVGNHVFIHHIPNQAWISLLKMDILSTLAGADAQTVNWTPQAYDVYYERKITAVNGNIISFDAPVMDVIDPLYTTAEVVRFNDYRIQKCGIENMRITSTYTSNTDENHGWEAIAFKNIINAWASNIEVYYFGFAAVNVNKSASFITVDNCKMLDAKSQITGGRRYSFNVDGQRTLVKNCTTRSGRHDYVTGSIAAGPNVFYNCTATLQQNNIGPHQRWSTGILFDQIVGNGQLDVENRTTSGSGHGWAGAQIMFWNCMGSEMVLQDPPGEHRNWAVGFKGVITNVGFMTTEPMGIKESNGTYITAIPSLFNAQLNERLSNNTLPIVLGGFNIKAQFTSTLISWSTVSEKNNYVFLVEHATNNLDFKIVGEVKGKGNSNQTANYQFEHLSPVIGLNYYRLKQVDFDGNFTYSPIKVIKFKSSGLILKSNVVEEILEMNITQDVETSLFFYNSAGQKMLTIKGKGTQLVNVSSFQAGVYYIKTAEGDSIKFLKL
ncbi:hypothetical protein [Pedobacter cryophilus]|uniref:Secretion system C-terminal sorting domain-containing protein n=1 Tax=Pedobacter cryophilus TaxID=2571271 RepID=A0A4U1C0W3_9SPHI|nr:hypothetical protein [Pedobacter cryophilus]TKB98685.1 hypothetical protein FA046_06090 [Pedobacter cryophilus]